MSICVDTKHPDFKKLVESTFYASSLVEHAVHSLQNRDENLRFPSLQEVINFFQPKPYESNSFSINSDGNLTVTSEIDKCWLNFYSEPKVFSSRQIAENALLEAARIFGNDNCKLLELNNGKFELRVAKPSWFASLEGLNILPEIKDEMYRIKANAIKDGTFMKAPNGAKTNLTESQWLQVRTKAFEEWFGDWINNPENASKVVDENGEPLVVYHGSENGLQSRNSTFVYFSDSRGDASIYSQGQFTKGGQFFSNNKGTIKGILEYLKTTYNIVPLNEDMYDYYVNDAMFAPKDSEAYRKANDFIEEYNNQKERIDKAPKEVKDLLRMVELYKSTTLRTEGDLMRQYDDEYYIKDRAELDKLENEYNHLISTFRSNPSGVVDAMFLNIRNPYTDEINSEDLSDNWKAYRSGHDGALLMQGEHFLVKNNTNQIKSATDNVGTFRDKNIYEEHNSVKNGKVDSRLQRLGARQLRLNGDNSVTLQDLLSIVRDSEYSSIVELLEHLNKLKELDDIKVELTQSSDRNFDSRRAYYDASYRTIYINVNAQYENGDASSVILHEVLHPLTIDRIQQNPDLKNEIQEIINEFQKVPENFNSRYLPITKDSHHIEEFIADIWSNPDVIRKLKNTRTSTGKWKNLWNRVKSFFNNLFSGIFEGTTDDSLMAKASATMIKLLETEANENAIGKYYEPGIQKEIKVEVFPGYWTREQVEAQQDKVFLFEDNIEDRTNNNHVPTNTQAVIRGLPNAIGIDTKKNRGTSENSYFTDADFDTFVAQTESAIQQALDSGKTIVLPENGIGTGAAQLRHRAPKLYNYLQQRLKQLRNPRTRINAEYVTPEEFILEENSVQLTDRSNVGTKLGKSGMSNGVPVALVARDVTVQEFFDYIEGKIESPTSKQKQVVFAELAKLGYTKERLQELVKNPEDAQRFIAYHELSHLFNNDLDIYYRSNERGKENPKNWMLPEKIAIELNATIDAWTRLESEKAVENESSINIWHSTGEHAELSNFAERPFILEYDDEAPNMKYYEESLWNIIERAFAMEQSGVPVDKQKASIVDLLSPYLDAVEDEYGEGIYTYMKFESVEQAFQFIKSLFLPVEAIESTPTTQSILTEIHWETSGSKLKSLGRKYKLSPKGVEAWNSIKADVMKFLIKESFKQNRKALRELLATKNTRLTHIQDRSEWRTLFPKLLMEVREELRREEASKYTNYAPIQFEDYDYIELETSANVVPQVATQFHMHSGGAIGSDTYWGEIGDRYGVTSNHYYHGRPTPKGNKEITRDEFEEGKEHVRRANETLKRGGIERYLDFLARNWIQVKNADSIFAIGHIVKEGEKNSRGFTVNATQVDGGTGWAVQMAIDEGKPVFVFDQVAKKWFTYGNGTWVETSTPILTQDFAGIGTREINEAGKKAIEDVYANTFESKAEETAIQAVPLDGSKTLAEPEVEERTIDTQGNEVTETINKIDEYMQEQLQITQQIDNLLNDNFLSATEVREIAEQAVWWISDHLTELQQNPEEAARRYGSALDGKDISKMSRLEILNAIGAQNIMAMCKGIFSAKNNKFKNLSLKRKANKVTSNWLAIMTLAQNYFLENEDFSLVLTPDGKTMEVNTDLNLDADNFNISQDEATIKELEGSLQEHWQIETKTLDVLRTMSQQIKHALRQLYIVDRDGNVELTDFGIKKRVNIRTATQSILRWTQGSLTLEDMVVKLQEKATDNPWVQQLITRLTDTTGKETDFQGQFFGTFCKHFQSYSIVIQENGRYKSITVNENPALTEAMTQISSLQKIGEHPLFTSEGLNKETYKELKESYKEIEEASHNLDLEDATQKSDIAKTLGYISNIFGYYVTPEMVEANLTVDNFRDMYSALSYIMRSLEANKDNKEYTPFEYGTKGSIGGNMRVFLKPITDMLEDTAVSAFYDSGKMYQSYITPSYTSKLFQKFSLVGEEFDKFIQDEYGKFNWFHLGNDLETGWRNEWLRLLVNDENARKIFKHKVSLNFNKKNYMRDMSDVEYALSLLTEYFSEKTGENKSKVPAWFRVPMLSNKPSSEFIRFYSERGSNYKDIIVEGLFNIFAQELSRIQTVEMRNLDSKDQRFIKNFDKNGRKFNFLDFMNDYLTGNQKDSELGKLIRSKLNGEEINDARLHKLASEVIKDTMRIRTEKIMSEWKNGGIIEGAKNISNIGTSEAEIEANLENFIWNDTYAAMNIMQLTITDIAFYKDAEDLQKRLAQIHAPGIRGNVHATDYEGKEVTDGKERTIYLTDFDNVISNIIDNVSIVFDRKIANATTETERRGLELLKESLVGEDGQFRKINVADAQGYNSPTSYRKKALIFGKWSKQAEEIYQKLRNNEYTYSDLQVAFQPLKPFVYSQIQKDMGVEGAPMPTAKMPIQNKNSEYLLIMADAILQGEETGKPNLLRAIYQVMEESHYDENGNYKKDGIDTVQFESTVKSGLTGRINLNPYINVENGEAMAKAVLEASIYQTENTDIDVVNEETGETEVHTVPIKTGLYNKNVVQEIPFEDYCLQQEVPEHFKDHAQIHGSQLRYIIVSELADKDSFGNDAVYTIKDSLGERKVSAEEFKAEYEDTVSANIQESINELSEELHINTFNTRERNIALSKILQREILSSPRYGVDLLLACSVDENGKFRIPLGDPIQSKRVEQLINSIIKNRINKQEIAGGPVVQVTNFGTSRQLNIRFKDKNGGLLKTREEFEKENKHIITAYQGTKGDTFDNRAQNYFTLFKNEAENYGLNVRKVGINTTNFLQMYSRSTDNHGNTVLTHTKEYAKLLNEFTTSTGKRFDILDNSATGLQTQKEFFEFVQSQGYKGLDLVSGRADKIDLSNSYFEENPYLVTFDQSSIEETPQTYEEYIRKNQGGIAYFEVFAPIYSNKLFEKFADKNGNINIEAIEALNPDLLKMIGYRIPTEAKYSMAPLKIVGFLPREAGDGIMLPYDITLLTGSDFDVDKEYLMRLDYELSNTRLEKGALHRILFDDLVSSQEGEVSKKVKRQLDELISRFLSDPFDKAVLTGKQTREGFLGLSERAYGRMLRTFVKNAYTLDIPTSGTRYRNNKIVNMTYEVLTHETSAAEMLNPGGFDQQKKTGYMVTVFRDPNNSYTWEELSKMSIDELKDLSSKNKNLSFVDTHLQFYKQNAAAGSLIGIFAVNRTAHAVIENEGYQVDVKTACGVTEPFTIAGMTFTEYMPIDVRLNKDGESVGKILGSLVASAADAVKDPILNLMNINKNTSNILTTLIRMGMPWENAALLLSQSSIAKVLSTHSSRSVSENISLNKVIKERLAKIEKETGISKQSPIQTEELTKEELIRGLKDDISPEIEYKTLKMFLNISKLSTALRLPTFATRFNSISSAVGPLIIDNLAMEYNMADLNSNTKILDKDGNLVDIFDILKSHPILGGFASSLGIAKNLFGSMPANSSGFRAILDNISELPVGKAILNDRSLLSKLSDFYQSYLAIAGGVIDESRLIPVITRFPKKFIERNYKEKYKDNFLIQSIKYGTDKSGKGVLKIDTTGLDETVKQKLSSAWIDLHKENPELSKELFEYCFFKGGMGFNPKSFMNLVPVQVKEQIPKYVETYRLLPTTLSYRVFDQFVRNNWENKSLVPFKSTKSLSLKKGSKEGEVVVYEPKQVESMKGTPYFKIAVDKSVKLYRMEVATDSSLTYKEVSPLGNNKDYLEISLSDIVKAKELINTPTEDATTDEIVTTEVNNVVEDGIEVPQTQVERQTEQDLLYQVYQVNGRTRAEAEKTINKYKTRTEEEKKSFEKQIKSFIERRFTELGIEYNEELIDKVYKLMC